MPLYTARLLSLPLHTCSHYSPPLQPVPLSPLPSLPHPRYFLTPPPPISPGHITRFHGSPSHSSSILLTLTVLPLTHSLHHPVPASRPTPFQPPSDPTPSSPLKPLPAPPHTGAACSVSPLRLPTSPCPLQAPCMIPKVARGPPPVGWMQGGRGGCPGGLTGAGGRPHWLEHHTGTLLHHRSLMEKCTL